MRTVITSIKIDHDIYDRIKEIANQEDKSIRSVMNAAMTYYVMSSETKRNKLSKTNQSESIRINPN